MKQLIYLLVWFGALLSLAGAVPPAQTGSAVEPGRPEPQYEYGPQRFF